MNWWFPTSGGTVCRAKIGKGGGESQVHDRPVCSLENEQTQQLSKYHVVKVNTSEYTFYKNQ